MDAAPTAPPVVAVVVTSDAGPWLEACLAALGEQDYPALSVLVVDAGSAEDPTPRVASVLPNAFVRRVERNPGFGPAANEVLSVVEGASHFLFCHDDVAPDPDAVRLMLEEAYRSNAGIVCPKLVDWDDPRRLLQVGMSADKSGAPVSPAEHGELDQEQHDGVRDVFWAPGACMLVRADLFASLGGFDPGIDLYGEDLDLSWRAQIAGARVVVAPAARVRHREAMSGGRRAGFPSEGAALRAMVRPRQLRHRLRAVLKNYGLFHLARVLPQAIVLALAEIVYGLVSGRRRTSRDIVGAWVWNARHWQDLRAARRQVRRTRVLPDREVRRLQTAGSARVRAFLFGQLAGEDRRRLAALAGRDTAATLAALRLPALVWGVVAVVLGFGSRHVLNGPLPAVGELVPFPDAVLDVVRPYLSGWRTTGLGSESPAPTAFALLGLGGTLLLGGMGLLQKLLVLGMVPVGAIGVYRLVRPLGSVRARLAGMVVYLAVPLAYNALARGRWGALVLFGAAPWLVGSLMRATGLPPFGEPGATRTLSMLRFGVLVALVVAFVPAAVLVVPLAAVGLVAGSVLGGGVRPAARAVLLAFAGLGVAVVLHVPWSLDYLVPGAHWSALGTVDQAPAQGAGLGRLLRFETGPLGAPPLGWAFLVAAALPLLIARSWRFEWAARLWGLAVVCWAVAFAGGRGWLGVAVPSAEVLLVPAALALATCVALGLAAFESDLPGYRLGWRQLASVAAAGATALGTIPVVVAAADGRWKSPTNDYREVLAWMRDQRAAGAFRVLWLGHPEALPLDGWRLDEGVAYATSRGGAPGLAERWAPAEPGAAALLADAVNVARRGHTTRLGHLLSPMAVRYVVIPTGPAPSRTLRGRLPVAPDVPVALAAQLDLRQVATDRNVTVYENAAWLPGRALLTGEAADASRSRSSATAVVTELAGSPAVLAGDDARTTFTGRVPEPGDVYLSEATSPRWELTVAGEGAPRRRAFGWANAFSVDQAGQATLRYRTSPLRWLAVAVQLALWAAAVRVLVRERRR